MEFINSIPLGYRFIPTDCELIEHYLKKKINGEKLPTNDFQEISINLHHPQKLCTAKNRHKKGQNWYFFTRRERKYKKGSKPNRGVKDTKGYWKATGVDAKITKENGQIIGYKMTLDYNEEKGIKSHWKMHEFRINKKSPPPDDSNSTSENKMELDKYVLCEIYINTVAKIEDNDEASNSRNNDNIINQDGPSAENINMYDPNEEKMKHGRNSCNNDNIIDQDGPCAQNINMYNSNEEKMEHGQKSFNDDNIIDQDDSSAENINMYDPNEQNFMGMINDNLEFGDDQQFVQEITTPNLLSSSSNYDDHENVHDFNGFDELSVVVKHCL